MASLATLEELSDRIPGGLDQPNVARAQAMLDDASALIRTEAGKTWDAEEVPALVATVCISAAKRAFLNPEGINSLALDGHSATFATGSPDVYLTAAERNALRRVGGRTGLWTQSTTRSEYDALDTPAVRNNTTDIFEEDLNEWFGP